MLPKLPELPGEAWAAISDRILDLDVLLRLTCVNKSIQKSCVPAITHARKYDNYLFDSLLECMKIEVEKHIGIEMFFQEIGRDRESGSPVQPRGYLGYGMGWDVTLRGERYTCSPTRLLSKLTVRSGFVKAIGGFTFVFPGDETHHEIECWATMNALGVDSVVLRSLNGERMISNLDPGGLDLPSGSNILDFLKLFDEVQGRRYWDDQELLGPVPLPDPYWPDGWDSDLEVMNSTELEDNEGDDTAHIDSASGDEADECDCVIVEELKGA